jgi:hypothetical protein
MNRSTRKPAAKQRDDEPLVQFSGELEADARRRGKELARKLLEQMDQELGLDQPAKQKSAK